MGARELPHEYLPTFEFTNRSRECMDLLELVCRVRPNHAMRLCMRQRKAHLFCWCHLLVLSEWRLVKRLYYCFCSCQKSSSARCVDAMLSAFSLAAWPTANLAFRRRADKNECWATASLYHIREYRNLRNRDIMNHECFKCFLKNPSL